MEDLTQKRCIACEGNVTPFNRVEAEILLKQVKEWELSNDATSISKLFTFKNFADAMMFANAVAAIAESEGHHPDLSISWGKVGIELSTHAIKGLSENDFIMAAKIDTIQ